MSLYDGHPEADDGGPLTQEDADDAREAERCNALGLADPDAALRAESQMWDAFYGVERTP